jgi:hypothetical protein
MEHDANGAGEAFFMVITLDEYICDNQYKIIQYTAIILLNTHQFALYGIKGA